MLKLVGWIDEWLNKLARIYPTSSDITTFRVFALGSLFPVTAGTSPAAVLQTMTSLI